jgi:nucleotide-binding universal stress UspA family protein
MYDTILLAYDGTREGRIALRQGTELGLSSRAKVYLLAVMAPSSGIRLAEAIAPTGLPDRERELVEQILEDGVNELRARGLNAEGRLAEGEPAERICAVASEIGADLIVVGHQHKGALFRWWSGSVGAYILEYAPCSILVAIEGKA